MAFKKVLSYSLGYSTDNKQFMVNYSLEGVSAAFQFFPTPEDSSVLRTCLEMKELQAGFPTMINRTTL
jgi:hypothetical protein